MHTNTKLEPLSSNTFERIRASFDQLEELGPRIGPFRGLVAEMQLSLQLLESPTRPTEKQLKARYRALEQAEDNLSPWPRKTRPSRRKPGFRLIDVVDEVLLVPRFAAAPMSAATVREIQVRSPQAVERDAIIKAIQRRALDKCGMPQLSNDAVETLRHDDSIKTETRKQGLEHGHQTSSRRDTAAGSTSRDPTTADEQLARGDEAGRARRADGGTDKAA